MTTTHNTMSSSYVSRLIIAALTIFSSLTLYAEDVDSLRYYDLKDIVVIGMREQAASRMLPFSATTIEASHLNKLNITGLKDITGIVPNFIMLDRDTPLTSSVFMRGMGSLLNPAIIMYVDGVPHFEKSSFELNMSDIEKIEFLRGPQGTQFGRNAMGGTIVVQTRSPFKYQGSHIDISYGRFNGIDIKASHLSKINANWAYSLSGNYHHTDGYIENVYTGDKADRANNGSLNAKLEWRPEASTLIRFTNNFDYIHQGAYTYGLVTPENMLVENVSLDHPSSYIRKINDAGVQITHDRENVLLRNQVSLQLLSGDYDVDQDGSEKNIFYAIQGEREKLLTEEFSLLGKNEGWYHWSVGGFLFLHDIDRTINVHTPKAMILRLQDERTWGASVYHQSNIDLSEHFRLEAGLRYDYEKGRQLYSQEMQANGGPSAKVEDDNTLAFGQLTPKVSLQYLLSPTSHLYATVAKGYITGGFNPLFENKEMRTYGAESSWSYEIGAKGWIIPHILYGEAALFAINTHNKQLKMIVAGRGFNTYNAGQTMSKGVEVSLNAHPVKNWELSGSYGLTDATITHYLKYTDKVDYSGHYLPFAPRNTVSLNSRYTLPFSNSRIMDSIALAIGYKGIGDIYWHEDNIAKQKYYSLLDASITMTKGHLTYAVWGTNLTNTKYLGYYYTSQKKNFGKPGRPLMAGVRIGYDF